MVYFFFLLGSTPLKSEQPLLGIELQEKHSKDERLMENVIIKNPKIKGRNSKRGIPRSSCIRKVTVDLGTHITYRNYDRKIMQSSRISNELTTRKRDQFI